jgi:hypothetical protein
MSLFRKQTKLWKTKDGQKVRICDMSDDHLINTIKMLERIAKQIWHYELATAYSAANFLQGEMAIDSADGHIRHLEEEGPDVTRHYPIYENLYYEAMRRELTWE